VVRASALVVAMTSALACGSDGERAAHSLAPAPVDAAPAALPEVEPPPPPPPIQDPDFKPGTRSLRLIRSIAVRIEPGDEAKRIGTIAQDTRVAWTRTATAKGCKKPWVEIVPHGWVCGDYLEASTRKPSGVELPRLDRHEIVPGIYGKLIEAGATTFTLPDKAGPRDPGKSSTKPVEGPASTPSEVAGDLAAADPTPGIKKVKDPMVAGRPLLGSVTVRKYGEVAYGDSVYWKIARGNEYVARKAVREHKPSSYQGVRLGDETGMTLPMAFIWPRAKGVTKVWVRRNAKGQGALHQLDQRTAVPILETHEEGGKARAYRIGDGQWVMADQVRVVHPAEPPPLIGDHERWFDIDGDEQILVAYEGRLPVYATMVSTGKKDTPTEAGLWRMWKKVSETDMKGLSGEDPYSVATVPWTQFFDPHRGLALHASYWHDKFGIPRSHGCINLSPHDARWLYFWSEPQVPAGWTMTAGVFEAPGSIVRVRTRAVPDPPWKGYAKKVQEAREAAQR
jgi:hypothetical protein